MFSAFAILLCVTAGLAWLNERFVRIPTTVGVTLAGAMGAVGLILLDHFGLSLGMRAKFATLLETLNFSDFVLNGVLSILLFAGALSLDSREVWRQRRAIGSLAVAGTLISTLIISGGAWGAFRMVGIDLPLPWAMLLGALLSPTDPVAVLDMLSRSRVPARLQTLVAGESLFNDGIGVVLFIAAGAVAGIGGQDVTVDAWGVVLLFLREAIGGLALGLVLGWVSASLCKSVTGYIVEVLITLAVVIGGYVAASALGVSGPLAMVVAGLFMSWSAGEAFGQETRERTEGFWHTLEQVLTVLLFAFIGLDLLLTETSWPRLLASALLILVSLGARGVSVVAALAVSPRARRFYGPRMTRLLIWGGLRGGIAIGLALGLPPSRYTADLVTATFTVVLFTIAVQGLTVKPLIRQIAAPEPPKPS